MNRLGKRSLALVLALLVGVVAAGCGGGGGGGQGGSEEPKTLKLGIAAGWTENIAVANLVKVLLEEDLGYEEVETQTADLGVVFEGVGNGDLDAFQDMWLPNHAAQFESVENDVEQLDPWYQGEVKFGIVAPSYMNITSIDQLNEAGVRQIVGIDPGAIITTAILENTIPEYGLEAEYIQSSEAAMLSEVEQRYENQEKFAFIAWTPHWMNETYDFVYLEDPKNTLVNPEGDPLDQAKISTIVREDLQEDDPVAYAMLNAFKLDQEQTNTLEEAIQAAGADDPTVGVRTWLEENRDVVQPWIDAAKQAQEQAQVQ
jgi:glycine betaine/proline transport system substrate-binding protein